MLVITASFPQSLEQHIDNREVFSPLIPVENAHKMGQMLSEATGKSRPKAEVYDRPLAEEGFYDPHKNP